MSVGEKCDWQHSMAHLEKRRKNVADISYTSRVIAHFVPNFVAMATRENYLIRSQSYDRFKNCLFFPIGSIVIFLELFE